MRESNRNSLITVTRTILGKNERSAKIFFSVLPETDEVKVLSFLNRKRGEFAEYVDKHARIGMMPGIEFVIDSGEKNRQKIEGIPLDK